MEVTISRKLAYACGNIVSCDDPVTGQENHQADWVNKTELSKSAILEISLSDQVLQYKMLQEHVTTTVAAHGVCLVALP